ncbi:NAD(P)H-dependent glycerol-3-phosphate dehydrogenase [Marinibacterium profundimaris]|uniref:Glycerol-3-phosphate dehydrogenase [NAD(P)+] n=1 Tax=Marinibacterium profundimaris TaxID=1679460 RepID=A0A225NVL3_9RHOB|nr:NAD(P)H-dependent glycerol-3-phosphate dehydrogenase [Marinibacterium profundimaris]OWU75816.1 glycerol-3-phosphate dehydrogenase [Marinibacterium profundimaris]
MIGVMGGGAFGTALAVALCGSRDVVLWARSDAAVEAMRVTRRNADHLPGVDLPERLRVTSDTADLAGCDVVLLSVPMQKLRGLLADHGAAIAHARPVACCKGIELETGLGPHEVIEAQLPGRSPALLTGPSFAADIARGLPTALTLAADIDAQALQAQLSTPVLRLYRTDDLTGAAMGGALKNVMAIACAAAIGGGLGDSARAALMTRGYAEMTRYATAHGARAETLAGLSGLGDLALTCMSEGSRNYRLGLAIGAGKGFDPAGTVEGAATARAVAGVAVRRGIDMPITQGVTALLDGTETLGGVMDRLLARPLKEE